MLVYPTLPGLTLPVLKSVDFDTLIETAPNKYDVRLPQTVNPIWNWELIYDFLRDYPTPSFGVGELRTLLDFFLAVGGAGQSFLFLDPDDNSVGPAMLAGEPNVPLAQLSLITDGTYYYSPLQRTFGGLFYEDVVDLNTSPYSGGQALEVYCNGVEAYATGSAPGGYSGPTYQLLGPGLAIPGGSYMGMYLQWSVQPTAPITAQFSFYFRCRFESDSQDMEKFSMGLKKMWTIGGSESQNGKGYVKISQSRPNPL
jgi:hypothetical protein